MFHSRAASGKKEAEEVDRKEVEEEEEREEEEEKKELGTDGGVKLWSALSVSSALLGELEDPLNEVFSFLVLCVLFVSKT